MSVQLVYETHSTSVDNEVGRRDGLARRDALTGRARTGQKAR